MYVNGLLEILNETTGAFILDERNSFRPAGLGRFGRSRGGHLEDDPPQGQQVSVVGLNSDLRLVTSAATSASPLFGSHGGRRLFMVALPLNGS